VRSADRGPEHPLIGAGGHCTYNPEPLADFLDFVVLGDGEEVVGGRTKVTVVKNKVAPPFRKVEFDMLYNRGISREGEVLELGILAGAVLKSGTWFSFKHPTQGELRLGQGLEKARTFLVDNPDLMAAIEGELRGKLKPSSVGSADAVEPAAPVAAPGSQTRL